MSRWWLLLACAVLLLITNAGVSQTPDRAALEYRLISAAAPGLPSEPVGSAYAGRFAVHYIVGLLSHSTGLSLDVLYDVVFTLLLAALAGVIYVLWRDLPLRDFALCVALFAFNPYSLRPYLLQDNLVEALLFVVGFGVCLLGLRHRSTAMVLLGLTVAVLARQTAIALAPVAAAWVLIDSRWRLTRGGGRRPWFIAFAALMLTYSCFGAVRVWVSRFSYEYEPSLLRGSVFRRVVELPGAAIELAAHFARTAIPLAVPASVLVSLIAVVGVRRVRPVCWGFVLAAASVAAQPAMIDPEWPGFKSNEQRLAALAILPLVCAIAVLLAQSRWRARPAVCTAAMVAVVALASSHHQFSAVGPATLSQFLAIQLAVAGLSAALIIVARRPLPDASIDRTTAPASRPVPSGGDSCGRHGAPRSRQGPRTRRDADLNPPAHGTARPDIHTV